MEKIQSPFTQPDAIYSTGEETPNSMIYIVGYALLSISFCLYVTFAFFNLDEGEHVSTFVVHYLLALVYVVLLITDHSYGITKSWRKENIHKTVILLNLFLISAYALNRVFTVFQDSTDWLCACLIIASITTLSYRFFHILPLWINRLQQVLLGSAIVLYIYLSIFVAHIYGVGTIGILFLGIGMHAFVPLTVCIACLCLLRFSLRNGKMQYHAVLVGVVATLAYVTSFVIEWNTRVTRIETLANQSVMYPEMELPVWVTIGQSLKNDWISQRILKSDLVYTTHNRFADWQFMPSSPSWSEVKKHDPLVYVASFFAGTSVSKDDRVKILQSFHNGRHQAQERLWSGDNLTTSYIVSDVDIYTDLRLAYTEKYLNIRNNAGGDGWGGNTEEAIYTFQLPEGSVVTSLSLWINGTEQKGILTSKQKAVKAYKTIVGVEARDPSVVHWQEGNTVSVRIFPCTKDEERKFKIGVTSPLRLQEGKVYYEGITFRGPSPSGAKETHRIRFIGGAKDVDLPGDFMKDKKGDYIFEQSYDPDFAFSYKAVPIKDNRFSFNGYTYSLATHEPKLQQVSFKNIYLDINNSWSQDEIDALSALSNEYTLYACVDQEMMNINTGNWKGLTRALHGQNFSLFPFHRVKDIEHSLVITKGKDLSPHLRDFKDSKFAQGVRKFFAAKKKVKVYNLEGDVSTYVSSFRELRGLDFAEGPINTLLNHLENKTFPLTEESDECIILHDAHMIIRKVKHENAPAGEDNAPDHLARLFAYNNIMRNIGSDYFNDDYIDEALVEEAATAYVVSPVSSLIVLETQEDYKRFGIHDIDNSLLNASKNSSGAVPEPHEWMLIILFLTFIAYTIYRSKLRLAQ